MRKKVIQLEKVNFILRMKEKARKKKKEERKREGFLKSFPINFLSQS